MTDFSLIFAPASPSSARTYGDGHAVHDSRRIGNLHSFHHLAGWEGADAAGETQRAQQTNHEEEP